MNITRALSILVMFFGLVSLIFGSVFLGLGFSKDGQLKEAMRAEHVSLGIESPLEGQVIDSLPEAQLAGDTIREHRHGLAATYEDLGRFDPTNPEHLTYAQALNLENYLYLAVVAFGLTQVTMGAGAVFIVIGLALGGMGWAILRISRIHA